MRSFIPWVGGKSQLCPAILSHFPDEGVERYVEAFGGGGTLLFSRPRHAPLEVFNDIDGDLINLYRCIKYHCGELQRELRVDEEPPPNSRELFLDYKAQLDTRGLTDIQRAARYFYIIRISYGADRRTFGCNKKAMAGAIDRLPEIQQRIQEVVLERRDFEDIIRVYDRPHALLYLDPPYYQAEKFYDGFGLGDHERLFRRLQCLQGRFVLSYNDVPFIRELYAEFHLFPVERPNSLASGKYKELIITNFYRGLTFN